MNIKQLEQHTGMTRANIRFYENEGLIAPARRENKYRDYSDKELEVLNKIKFLRSLSVSIDEIKALQNGNEELSQTLTNKIIFLESKQREAQKARELCVKIKEDKATYETLNPDKYLNAEEKSALQLSKETPDDEEKQAFCPWRRYFARAFDLMLYTLLWLIIVELAFKSSYASISEAAEIINMVVPIFLMLTIEPVLLTLFKTTPGKFILGLRLESRDTENISYKMARTRTWEMFFSGCGMFIPVYSFYVMWKNYKRCSENEPLPWDCDFYYTIKDENKKRSYALALACISVMILSTVVVLVGRMPRYTGNITVSEFADNFNGLNRYYSMGLSYTLNSDGQFVEESVGSTEFTLKSFDIKPPILNYKTDSEGSIKELYFTQSNTGADYAPAYTQEMLLLTISLAGAQKDIGIFSSFQSDISKLVSESAFADFTYSTKSAEISCDYEIDNYYVSWDGFAAFSDDGGADYSVDFKIVIK